MLTVSVGFWAIYLAAGSLGLSHTTPRTLVDIQGVRRTLFLVVGVGGSLALLLGLALAYSIRRPIRQLLRRVEAGTPLKQIDELADLAELTSALNQLLVSLETLSVKLQQVERQRHG